MSGNPQKIQSKGSFFTPRREKLLILPLWLTGLSMIFVPILQDVSDEQFLREPLLWLGLFMLGVGDIAVFHGAFRELQQEQALRDQTATTAENGCDEEMVDARGRTTPTQLL